MPEEKLKTGYPSIDKPWLKYYSEEAIQASFPDHSIYESIFYANNKFPNQTALDYYGIKATYREFFQNIENAASALITLGIKKNDIVTVCMINSPEAVYLLYAINKIGAIANMISGLSEPEEIVKHISGVYSTVLFTLDIFLEKILSLLQETPVQQLIFSGQNLKNTDALPLQENVIFRSWEQFLSLSSIPAPTLKADNDIAAITYTGGTTGNSKGVLLSNKSIISSAQQYLWCRTAIRRGQTWLQTIPFYVAFGVVSSLQLPLMAGQELILRTPLAQTLGELFELKPNHVLFGPAQWEQLADEGKPMDLSFLIEPTSGGDKLPIHIEEKITAYLLSNNCAYPLMNGYGMSEVSAGVASNFQLAHKTGSVGVPYCKNIIAAFDTNSGEECPYNTEGEICIHTPSMMIKYVNNPEETEKIIQYHSDGLAWVHTGDLGYISEDGFVFISGRIKRYFLYIEGSEQKKIFCVNIENVLLSHPEVEACTVVSMPDKEHYQVAVAYIKLNHQQATDQGITDELKTYCSMHLDARACPKQYFFVSDFPRTSLGKIDYRALEERNLPLSAE